MKQFLTELVKPNRLENVTGGVQEAVYGKFIAEPLERGYGTTIGNTLRRYLLSSIPGSAVVGVKIEGIHHEFSTLNNVFEDVSEIILNLKELIIDMEGDETQVIKLNASGKKEVTGEDLECPPGVSILNTECHIASLMDKNAEIKAEIFVGKGRGYVPSEELRLDDTDIALIPIDANFSPIKKVNFTVEKTRVGHSTDYDKLILEVWTNGTVDPEDALSHAARLQREHLLLFMNVEEEEVEVKQAEIKAESRRPVINLNRSVEEMELSVRSYNCLQKANIKTISELVQKTDSEMLKTRNFGRKSLNEIKAILSEMGLRLGMTKDEISQYSAE